MDFLLLKLLFSVHGLSTEKVSRPGDFHPASHIASCALPLLTAGRAKMKRFLR